MAPTSYGLSARMAPIAAAACVLSQILWILVPDSWRDATTIAGVLLFFLASISHAIAWRGARWAAGFLALVSVVTFGAEAFGTHTGLLFGDYTYDDRLGPMIADVPLLIPLAWAMMAYPVWLAASRTFRRPAMRVLHASALLTAWDLFLDPQMVAEGHWTWHEVDVSLPGIPGIPLSNYLGWFLVSTVVMTGLALWDRLSATWPGPAASDDRVPAAMLLWVYGSNVLAGAAFWGRPWVSLIGGLTMGLLLLPWLRTGILTEDFWRPTRRSHSVGPPEPVIGP